MLRIMRLVWVRPTFGCILARHYTRWDAAHRACGRVGLVWMRSTSGFWRGPIHDAMARIVRGGVVWTYIVGWTLAVNLGVGRSWGGAVWLGVVEPDVQFG